MEICRFVVSPIQANCYILAESLERGAKAVIVDPGDIHLDPVFQFIDETGLRLVANWNTHAHLDHIIGADLVRERYGIPSYVHIDDAEVWKHAHEAHQTFIGTPAPAVREPDQYVHDGDTFTIGDETFTVWHTPGHSPGSVCFVGSSLVLSGDTLFAGTVGRTDLDGSSPEDMERSLERILAWSDDLAIYPGHGHSTNMRTERANNRFLVAAAKRDHA